VRAGDHQPGDPAILIALGLGNPLPATGSYRFT